MKTSYFSELKSHPGKALEEHLEKVGSISSDIIQSKKLNLDAYMDFDILCDICHLMGVCHDFGKATAYFQEYISLVEKCEGLEDDSPEKKRLEKKIRELKNRLENKHGHLSAVLTYHVVKGYLIDKGKSESRYYEYLPLICFLVVKRHHGNLKNALGEVKISEEIPVLKDQLNKIDLDKIKVVYTKLLLKDKLNFNFYDLCANSEKYMEDIRSSKKLLMNKLKEQEELFYFILSLLLYSILLDADKKDAIFSKNPIETRPKISADLVDLYRQIKGFNTPSNKINEIRNDIYKEVLSQVDTIQLENRIYSLNVPTGTGKTLTSLFFALKFRDRIEKEKGYTPRIIYSLPFMSIIDQNYEVFEDVFIKAYGEKPKTNILLKHHHLSDISYEIKDDGDDYNFDTDERLFLIEGWNSEIVVTTFVQFFHTLISNKNRAIRKYHNIVNSIVILDEIQSIPHKYWLLLNQLLKIFSDIFNTYFILVTATQPLIFDEYKSEITPLVKDSDRYFKKFNRVTLRVECKKPKHIDEFKEILKTALQSEKDDILIVLNTIKSSKQIHQFITSQGLDAEYLSTNITPKERLQRIKKIKDDHGKIRRIIVSTQLIEAGVDIDVATVYRDLGPLDSINQVCGRCNRNYSEDKKGKMIILSLKDDKKEYQQYIYDSFLINKTREILQPFEGKEIEETSFFKLNQEYFKKVKDLMSEDESKKLIHFLESLNFGEIKNFKLMEEDYFKVDVFIELDKNSQETWKKFLEIKSIKKPIDRKKAFLEIRKDFYEYVISVPKNSAESIIDENYEKYGICHVSLEEVKNYYDPKTGYRLEDAGCGSMIC